jgi:class 3 adenylate cyclase/tetratricopeptide (TPR) repeat protein
MKFCGECAAPLSSACPSCGAANPPGHKFCGQCAAPLRTAPTAPSAAPESYTPKHLAEKILTSKAALEGERKQVTVLFADLKGSMELLADRDPEEARKLLDPVLEHMMEAVHRYEGTVNQVMGDGIMALFGAPLAHEDHAVRACYAALRMQETVKQYADGIFRTYGVPVRIRVGLNSGEVVVRSIGSDLHMDYTAVGQTTHLAARMEQMADPGTILLTSDTLHLAEGFVHVQSLGRVAVKGLTTPAEIFVLTGVSAVRSRLQAAAARGLTTFVGRDAEMDTLFAALEQAKGGKGQLVAVVGEPGVGKSRLFWEFAHSHRTNGCLLLEAASVSYGKATAYVPVVGLLSRYFQIEPRDEPRKIREKVTGKLFSLDRALEGCLAPLLWLLDVPGEDPEWERLDPPQRRHRLLDGLRRLVLRESQMQPLVLVFEDLHWIDSETQALLDQLVESLPTARLLLMVNYRPEYAHSWGRKTYYRQVRIDPLSAASAGQLLGALLGHDPSVVGLGPVLIARTEGNPFFLEETVQSLIETGALTGDRGAYRLVKPPQALNIPATAQSVLAARIDRLEPDDKRLLQTASVIGKDLAYPLLRAIADPDETALRASLGRLQGGEFLYEVQLFPELEYTFKHALTHEAAYGSLLHDRRKALHGQIVDAIETLHVERLDEHAERLAHHAVRSERWDKAVHYLRGAGATAFARSANAEAVAHFERAVEALAHLPTSQTAQEQAIDIRFDLRNSLLPLGEVDRALAYVREAAALAEKLDDQRRLGAVSVFMSHMLWIVGEHAEGYRSAQKAFGSAEALDDFVLRVNAMFYLGITSLALGNYSEARECFEGVTRLLAGDLERERFGLGGYPAAMARCFLSWALGELGEFEDGVAIGQEGIRIAEAVDHAYSLIMTCFGLGHLYGIKGDFGHGLPLLERSVTLCRERNVPINLPMCLRPLGYASALSGRVDEGRTLLRDALSIYLRTPAQVCLPLCMAQLGEVSLLADDPVDALSLAERALAAARQHGERGHEAYALRLLGELASRAEPADAGAAEAYYREAMTLAGERSMRPLVAHCHLGFANLFHRTGKPLQAGEHLVAARRMYREMDMHFWLERAGVELKGLG